MAGRRPRTVVATAALRRAVAIATPFLLASCSDPAQVALINLQADYVVVDGPNVVAAGDSVTLRVQSLAVGGGVAEWPVRIVLSPNWVISTEDRRLVDVVAVTEEPERYRARAVSTVRVQIPPATTAGWFDVGAIVDPDERLPDSTREDNTWRGSLRIGVGLLPVGITAAPALLTPADRDTIAEGADIAFSWTAVPGVTYYQLEFDECGEVTSPAAWWSSCRNWFTWFIRWETAADFTLQLYAAPAWRWRVRTLDDEGKAGPASEWRTLLVLR